MVPSVDHTGFLAYHQKTSQICYHLQNGRERKDMVQSVDIGKAYTSKGENEDYMLVELRCKFE